MKDHDLLNQWLQEGIIAAKAGERVKARTRLLDVVEQDQTNEIAWYWLYQLFDYDEDKQICLENLILINPQNEWARQELGRYTTAAAVEPAAEPSAEAEQSLTLKLVIAFWVGISIIWASGGIIASGEWLISGFRTRTLPYYITRFQVFELLIAIIFVIAGLMGLNVAFMLRARSMVGLYGSLILGLGLLLVGPIISLIIEPPNYLTLICTGGTAGIIVLLTLASQIDFQERSES